MLNTSKLDLGYTPEGEEIDDVTLPRWSEDLQDFMFIFRAAFESDYTSLNLHKWIDLIFGPNQQAEAAENNENVYYSLCYEKNIKWNEIKSPYHLKSIEIQIAEYGQVPVQIFETSHPKKKIKIPSGITSNM